MNMIKWVAGVLLTAGLVSASAGCSMETGAPADAENTDSVSQAYNASQCATVGAAATFPTFYNNYTSPTNYSTACNAIDVTSMASQTFANTVHWAGPLPTNSTACVNSSLHSIWYAKSGTSWFVVTETEHTGVWSAGKCAIADIVFATAWGQATRIASTGRTYNGSAFTTSQYTINTRF